MKPFPWPLRSYLFFVPPQGPSLAPPLQAFSTSHVSLAFPSGSVSIPAPMWPLVTSDLMACDCTWNRPLDLFFLLLLSQNLLCQRPQILEGRACLE